MVARIAPVSSVSPSPFAPNARTSAHGCVVEITSVRVTEGGSAARSSTSEDKNITAIRTTRHAMTCDSFSGRGQPGQNNGIRPGMFHEFLIADQVASVGDTAVRDRMLRQQFLLASPCLARPWRLKAR